MKRKVKRYDGEDESEVKLDDSGSSKDYGIDYSESTNPGGSLEDFKYQPEPKSFKEAFAAGRAAALVGGPKTFTWNGKSYTTDLASSKPSSQLKTAVQSRATSDNTVPKPSSQSSSSNSDYKTMFQKQQEEAGEGAKVFKRVASKIFNPKSQRSIMAEKDKTKGMAKGGSVSSASKRADGIAMKGHTIGRIC